MGRLVETPPSSEHHGLQVRKAKTERSEGRKACLFWNGILKVES